MECSQTSVKLICSVICHLYFAFLHVVFVGEWLFVFPRCSFSLSLFCNYFAFLGVGRWSVNHKEQSKFDTRWVKL